MFERFKDWARRRQRTRKAEAMLRRLTDRALIVMNLADQEARQSHLGYVGTEHLLLGLLQATDGIAAKALVDLGLNLEDIRRTVLTLLGVDAPGGPAPQ